MKKEPTRAQIYRRLPAYGSFARPPAGNGAKLLHASQLDQVSSAEAQMPMSHEFNGHAGKIGIDLPARKPLTLPLLKRAHGQHKSPTSELNHQQHYNCTQRLPANYQLPNCTPPARVAQTPFGARTTSSASEVFAHFTANKDALGGRDNFQD